MKLTNTYKIMDLSPWQINVEGLSRLLRVILLITALLVCFWVIKTLKNKTFEQIDSIKIEQITK
jgi:hypothetical protein